MIEVKNAKKGKVKARYNITIISNKPSQHAIENFNIAIAHLLHEYIDRHDTIPYNGRSNETM